MPRQLIFNGIHFCTQKKARDVNVGSRIECCLFAGRRSVQPAVLTEYIDVNSAAYAVIFVFEARINDNAVQ